jgi:8-hydroxy-5-deazaflavin:NADPH oxidoreductase
MSVPFDRTGASRRTVLALGAGAFAAAVLRIPAPWAQGAPTRIGIVGSGHIGGTVGTLWAKAGHPVLFSSRHPETLKDLVAAAGPNAKAGTPEEALAFGDAVLLAIPYKAYPEFGQANAAHLKGRIVLDAGNATQARDGALADEVKANGIGVTSQKYLPGARVVRDFNTLGYRVLETNAHKTPPIAIPIAGDDAAALQVAAALVRDAGFDPVLAGGLSTAAEFQMGAKGYGQPVPAPELRKILGLSS